MDKRSGSHYTDKTGRGKAARPAGEFDRYNYVDRDIYSNSRPNKKFTRKKGGTLKKALISLLVLTLLGAAGAIVYGITLSNKLDRSVKLNVSQYLQQPSEAPSYQPVTDKNVKNILLLGIDINPQNGTDGRSDTMMLMSIDNRTKHIRLVSFLRDTLIEIPGKGKAKLNAAYIPAHKDANGNEVKGDPSRLVATLQNNYRIHIDNYVTVNTECFREAIDAVGGIDIPTVSNLEANGNGGMNAVIRREWPRKDWVTIQPGTNVHMNGKVALIYARIREADSDFARTGRQRQVMELLISKVKSMGWGDLNSLVNDFAPKIQTDLSTTDLAYLVSIAGTVSNYKMQTAQIPRNGTFTEDDNTKGYGWVEIPDITANADFLQTFLYPSSDSGETESSKTEN
ncbi:MAG: LCP family protein [Clostridiales bacterium]|jgi:LCP family protein required for cell wall assembly|nr:LCP family protein [Clostridiales bacterium]